jgi:inner membrane transporter RhtA
LARTSIHEGGPTAAALLALISVQTGAAFGKSLFPVVGPEGVTALRLGMSALMLYADLHEWQHWSLNFDYGQVPCELCLM